MTIFKTLLTGIVILTLISCGGKEDAKQATQKQPAKTDSGLSAFELENGIGPIKEKITLAALDVNRAKEGEKPYKIKCAACHRLDERFIGPAQRYVVERRSPEFILNMMLNPDEMVRKHPEGKKLLAEYLSPMTNMNLKLEEAKDILEYLRLVAKEGREQNIPEVPVYKNKK